MKLVRVLAVPVLAATVVVGCSDSTNPADVTIADLVGTWNATKMEFTSVADPSQTFDLVQNGGSFTLTLSANGTLSGQQSLFGLTEPVGGTMTVANGHITVVDTTETPPDSVGFSFTLSGDMLTMNTSDVGWDFNFDDIDDPATLELVMRRQ